MILFRGYVSIFSDFFRKVSNKEEVIYLQFKPSPEGGKIKPQLIESKNIITDSISSEMFRNALPSAMPLFVISADTANKVFCILDTIFTLLVIEMWSFLSGEC